MLTQAFIDAQKVRNDRTFVAETKSGVIVIAHPGKTPPTDPKVLREEFGLLPDCPVITLGESRERIPVEALEARLAELQAANEPAKPGRRAAPGA